MTPEAKYGLDSRVWLEEEELPPLLPADLNVVVLVHSGGMELKTLGHDKRPDRMYTIISVD